MNSDPYLNSDRPQQQDGLLDLLQEVLEVGLVVVEALPKHQGPDHVGRGARNDCLRVERP